MPVPNRKKNVLALDTNATGKDYVVGDLHGTYDKLMSALDKLGFDRNVDRLLSTGDLIDRGEKNIESINLIFEPWFHAVRGNHEEMMINTYINHDSPSMWVYNGGSWIYNHDETELVSLARSLAFLPYVITVGTGDQRFNICHAELQTLDPVTQEVTPVDNATIDDWKFRSSDIENITWGRTVIRSFGQLHPQYHSSDLSVTFVGHTPIKTPLRVQQQIYIDGGAVFGHSFIIASPSDQMLYVFDIKTEQITSMNFADIAIE